MSTVVVAGAGLAGLTAAARLAEADHDVTVLERNDEVGGRVRTRRVDGFTVDRGFQVLFPSYPAARRELDLNALDLRPFSPGSLICRPKHRAVLSDPLREPTALVESALTRDVTLGDKLRVLRLRRDLAAHDYDEILAGGATPTPEPTIREYLLDKGFSERFLSNFVEPFYGGITLDRSLDSAARLFAYTFKALTEGRASMPAAGMAAIPEQLAERARVAGATLRLGEAVESVDARGDGARVETTERTVDADAAVVATDPKEARGLTGVDAVPTDAVGCVTGYYALEGPELDAGTRIMLNAVDPDGATTGAGVDAPAPNTVAPLSAVAPEYAPDGHVLLAATFLGEGVQQAEEADLTVATRAALTSWYPERRFESLESVAVERVPFSQFRQPPGSLDALPGPRAPEGAVYLAGDYTRWSSIQGALESGTRAARVVDADL
jgi:phytoene dehydrogenase-like protein